jgi:acetylglutamate kinase
MVMNIPDDAKAGILAQALPWITDYAGKTVVVKYGGAAMTDMGVKAAVAQDLVLMSSVGIRTVLVHGGGPEIDAMLRRLGKEPTFVNGLRYTDAETMEVVQMVLAGKVNKGIVALIQRQGGRALGLCGIDGGMIKVRRFAKGGVDLGFVGEIVGVEPAPVAAALAAGFIPVVATIAMGSGEDDAELYNINADTAAAELAGALGAEELVLLTDVPGVLRDVKDPASLIAEMGRAEVDGLIAQGVVSKGMIPKVECCARAVDCGVKRARILDGRLPHALLSEAFHQSGIGTVIR